MLHSALAVLAGFAVMAVIVMFTTVLAVRFILHLPMSSMQGGGPAALTPAYLATNIVASAVAALAGGYTTATIAGHDALAHGFGLAVLMVAMSLVSMRQAGSAQPRWYRTLLATAMPALAIGGAALCGALTSL